MTDVYGEEVAAEFWRWVDQSGDCWEFTGRSLNNLGMPLFSYGDRDGPGRRRTVAQRVAWALDGRALPRNQVLISECGTTRCVRPDHHRAGFRGERVPESAIRDRFWALVAPADGDACRPWLSYGQERGYGAFMYRGKAVGAHRIAWSFANDQPIPDGMFVCHRCDNPPCCNPDHLFVDAPAANSSDMASKGRARTGQRRRKLSEGQVREMRRRYAAGEASTHALARDHGVSTMVAWRVVNGRAYADVV